MTQYSQYTELLQRLSTVSKGSPFWSGSSPRCNQLTLTLHLVVFNNGGHKTFLQCSTFNNHVNVSFESRKTVHYCISYTSISTSSIFLCKNIDFQVKNYPLLCEHLAAGYCNDMRIFLKPWHHDGTNWRYVFSTSKLFLLALAHASRNKSYNFSQEMDWNRQELTPSKTSQNSKFP